MLAWHNYVLEILHSVSLIQAEASLNFMPDIRATLNLPLKIEDGLQRFCTSIEYNYIRSQSDINEFCEGVHIMEAAFQVVGRAPIRRNSENVANNTKQAAAIKEGSKQTREQQKKTTQTIAAKIRPARANIVEIGGSLDAKNEATDKRTLEKNQNYELPPGVTRTHLEGEYQEIIKYHVTLVAQADRTITVLSSRALAAGGIGAAGGGIGGAAAGAGTGATVGTELQGLIDPKGEKGM